MVQQRVRRFLVVFKTQVARECASKKDNPEVRQGKQCAKGTEPCEAEGKNIVLNKAFIFESIKFYLLKK